MTPNKNNGHCKLSPDAEKIISGGLRCGDSAKKIQNRIKKELDEKVAQKTINNLKTVYDRSLRTKRFFKKKGADIVREFLEKAKGGTDVSDLQAVVTQAVYTDLFRRYESEDDALKGIGMKDLLMLTRDYQKLNLACKRAMEITNSKTGTTALQSVQLLDLMESAFDDDPALKKAVAERRPAIMEKFKSLFGSEEFHSAMEDYESLQQVKEKYEESKSRTASGMAG